MVSIIVPTSIRLSVFSPNPNSSVGGSYLKREGPFGSFIKKAGDLSFSLLTENGVTRLFIQAKSDSEERAALAQLQQLFLGLSRGYRQRLRLIGVGYRAAIKSATSNNALSLKVGYSHEVNFPLGNDVLTLGEGASTQSKPALATVSNPITVQVSRLEGRSKATLISLQGSDSVRVHQLASNIRRIQRPDPYKGKGIHYDGEVLRLKKGKREG